MVHDNGIDFTGWEFQSLLENDGISPKPTTVKSPRVNAIVGRIHLTMGDMRRAANFTGLKREEYITTLLQAVSWDLSITVHAMDRYSTGHKFFGSDMILYVKAV